VIVRERWRCGKITRREDGRLTLTRCFSIQVKRMRRECPAEDCGAGIFMAQHFDRQYCGKCHLTYMFKSGEEGN